MQMNLKRMLHLNGIKRTLNLFLINHVFVGTKPLACNMKRKLLRGIGCPVGDGTTIVGPIECKGAIAIGKNCWIGKNCKVNGNGTVQIGDNCDLGPEVTFQTGGHAIGDRTRRAGEGEIYHQVIGNGTWIGGRSTICNNSSVVKNSALLEKNKLSKVLILILLILRSKESSKFNKLISKLSKENSSS